MKNQQMIFEDLVLDIFLPPAFNDQKDELPLLYILDGNAFAPSFAEAVKLQSRNAPRTKVSPMIIVGIGYPATEFFNGERRSVDYTPKRVHPIDPNDHRLRAEGGGLLHFQQQLIRLHQFVLDQLKLNAPKKIGILGHSLGGLCVLNLLQSPDLKLDFFTDYLAISPSLWWDQEEYFQHPLVSPQCQEKRLFISVGELEGDMVPLAQRAYDMLEEQSLLREVSYYMAPEENHMSIVFTITSRGLRWFCSTEELQ